MNKYLKNGKRKKISRTSLYDDGGGGGGGEDDDYNKQSASQILFFNRGSKKMCVSIFKKKNCLDMTPLGAHTHTPNTDRPPQTDNQKRTVFQTS